MHGCGPRVQVPLMVALQGFRWWRWGIFSALASITCITCSLWVPTVVVWPTTQTIEVIPGEPAEFHIVIGNRSFYPVTITTYDSSCSCTATDSLPLEISGRSRRSVLFTVTSPAVSESRSISSQQIRFYSIPVVEGLDCQVLISVEPEPAKTIN